MELDVWVADRSLYDLEDLGYVERLAEQVRKLLAVTRRENLRECGDDYDRDVSGVGIQLQTL